jgi:hypothetical protein
LEVIDREQDWVPGENFQKQPRSLYRTHVLGLFAQDFQQGGEDRRCGILVFRANSNQVRKGRTLWNRSPTLNRNIFWCFQV